MRVEIKIKDGLSLEMLGYLLAQVQNRIAMQLLMADPEPAMQELRSPAGRVLGRVKVERDPVDD